MQISFPNSFNLEKISQPSYIKDTNCNKIQEIFSNLPKTKIEKTEKKDPLELSYHQKVAFGMSLISLASLCLGGKASSFLGGMGFAFQTAASGYRFFQEGNLESLMPMGILGAQSLLEFTPLKPITPYVNFLLQGSKSYNMGKDLWKQTGIALQHANLDNYAKVARNLFVYSVNAFSSGLNFYNSWQNILSEPNPEGKRIEEETKEAKSLLCQGEKECPTNWSPEVVKKLYRKRSLNWHPDKNKGEEAAAAFEALGRAKETLLGGLSETKLADETFDSSPIESNNLPLVNPQRSLSILDFLGQILSSIDHYLSPPDIPVKMELFHKNVSPGPIPSDREFAHIHADDLISKSDLEGWHTSSAIKSLETATRELSPKLKKQIQEISQKIYFKEPSQTSETAGLNVAQKIRELKKGDEFWMSGGWTSKNEPGHAILYQFAKKAENTYDIYIYNTGAGIEYHYQDFKKNTINPSEKGFPEAVELSHEESVVCPFVKFEGVEAEEIGLGKHLDPFLFTRLISLQELTNEKGRAEEIYIKTFGPLNHRRIADPREENDFFVVAPQSSGTCSWRVLMYAGLRKHLKDLKTAESVEFHVKQDTMDRYCLEDLSAAFKNPIRRSLCLEAGRSELLELAKRHQIFIPHEVVERRRQQIQKALNLLQKEETQLNPILKLPPISYEESLKTPPKMSFSPALPVELFQKQTVPFSAKPIEVQTLGELIKVVQTIEEFKDEGLPYDVPLQIEKLVQALPRPSQLEKAWEGASIFEIKKGISSLQKALSFYGSYVLKERGRLLKEQNTAWALLATIHHLSTRINPQLKNQFGIFYNSFIQLRLASSFTHFSEQDQTLYQEIANYFARFGQRELLFDFKKMIQTGVKEKTIFPDETFFSPIIAASPLVAQQIEKMTEIEQRLNAAPWDLKKRSILLTHTQAFDHDPNIAYLADLRRAALQAQLFTYAFFKDSSHYLAYDVYKGKIFKDETLESIGYWDQTNWMAILGEAPNRIKIDISLIPDQLEAFDPSFLKDFDGCLLQRFTEENENHAVTNPLSVFSRIQSSSCQKELQSQLLIDHFSDHIEDLAEIKQQNLFLLSFFGPNRKFLLRESLTNSDFRASVLEFVEKGISIFSYKSKPDIKSTLFFIQVARRLKELDPSLFSKSNFTKEINRLLERIDLSEEEEKVLHLHRILQYRIEKTALNNLQEKETTNNLALQEILESWVKIQSKHFHSWNQYHSHAEAVRFIYDLSPVFTRLSSHFIHKFLLKLFPTSTPDFSFVQKTLSVPVYQSKSWIFNPLHGKVFLKERSMFNGIGSDFTKSKPYQDLFGDKKFPFKEEGNTVVFQNEQGQVFRIFPGISKSNFHLQINFEKQWYEYTPHSSQLSQIPKSLLADHFVFSSRTKTLYLNKKTLNVNFVDFEGKELLKKSVLVESKTRDLYLATDLFEDKSWLLERKYEDGSLHVQFPRFTSLEGELLEFIKTPRGLAWKGNPQYILKNAPLNLLGSCPNYLFIQKENEGKILVPLKPVLNSKKFTPSCEIDIQDTFRFNQDARSPQAGAYRFLEYDLKEGLLNPLNPEGALFLSYLLLAQKEYSKVLQIFKKDLNLKENVILSSKSKEILNMIIDWPKKQDGSPSAHALAFRAFLFLLKDAASFSEKEENMKALKDQATSLWALYQDKLEKVHAELRLSLKEIEEFKVLVNLLEIDLLRKGSSISWKDFKKNLYSYSHYSPSAFNEFRAVYQDFARAKTISERIFLSIKHFDFIFNSFNKNYYSRMLNSVMCKKDFPSIFDFIFNSFNIIFNSFNKNHYSLTLDSFINKKDFPPIPDETASREEIQTWIDQFGKSQWVTLSLNDGKARKSIVKEVDKQFFMPSLAKLLSQTQSESPLKPFTLSELQLSSSCFLEKMPINDAWIQRKRINRESSTEMLSNVFCQAPPLQRYKTAIEKERNNFLIELEKGFEKNNEEVRFTLKPGHTVAKIHTDLKLLLSQERQAIDRLKKEIVDLINQLPVNPNQKTLTQLLIEGKGKSVVTFDQAIDCFLEGKSEEYAALNSHLTKPDIQKLDVLISEFLQRSIEASQMEKSLKIDDVQELGLSLFAEMAYGSSEYRKLQRQFLVYEYRSGLRMREDQVSLILKMAEVKKCAAQFMMGGGKTSVIASNLLFLMARPGRIAFFISPATQITTLKENLGNMQKNNFHQEVIPIELKRHELTEKKLRWIQKQFASAKTFRKVILTTRETIESLNLEYKSLVKSGSRCAKREILKDLVIQIKEFGDVLVDEVDLILNPMQETNFPTGEKILISHELIEMTRHLFELLLLPEFSGKLKLKENQQAVLSEGERFELLEKALEKFFDTYEGLNLSPSYKQAFLGFILGKEKTDSFERQLSFKSKKPMLKDSVEAISLIKHLINDVLPTTLSKSTGENYGRVLDTEVVGPYNGVASPSFSEFGSPWEAMSYHFQTALSQGVTVSQIKKLQKTFYASATEEISIKGIALGETWEAQAFKELTGFSLEELKEQSEYEQAINRINQSPKWKLILEASTIAEFVGAYAAYLRSTPQDFADSFSSFDSFSGTIWNPESFPKAIQDHFYPSSGTEGKIVDVLLDRAQKNSKVHMTESIHIKKTLSTVLQGMDPERQKRVCGFIDTAGLFKESDGLSVAKEVLEFYSHDDRIQTVLFFGRPDPRSSMILMALKKGKNYPIIIGGTQKEQIEKHGITPGSTFLYYDQTHAEATDIQQKSDAINIVSVGHLTILRTLLQGILRLRGYFKAQDIELVVPKAEKEHFHRDQREITHQEIIAKLIDNQAIRKAEQTFRAYKQKIDHVLTQVAMEELLKAQTVSEEEQVFKQYEKIFQVETEQNLYAQFGMKDRWENSLQILQQYRNAKESLFKTLTSDKKLLEKVNALLEEVMQSAENCPYRPSEAKNSEQGQLGKELEIFQEVKTEISQEQELNIDLKKELDLSQFNKRSDLYIETPWEKKDIDKIKINEQASHPPLYSVHKYLSEGQVKYKKDYFKLFSKNLCISKNFAHTFQEESSIFNKSQKYGGQFLVLESNGQLKAILISTKEASFFKEHIENESLKNAWLMSSLGRSLTIKAPKMNRELKDLLWNVHLFNGNVLALIQDPTTKEKIKKLEPQLFHDFLAMKVEFDPKQKGIFYKYFVEGRAKKSLSKVFDSLSLKDSKEVWYKSLMNLGLPETLFQQKSVDVQNILLSNLESVKKLHKSGLDLKSIFDLSFRDLKKVLENTDSFLQLMNQGIQLKTFLNIIQKKQTLSEN